MPAPTTNWTLVQIRGRFVGSDGTPVQGRVVFRHRATRSVDPTAATTVVRRDIEAYLDETGSFAVDLPANDDPDISPIGATYHVTEDFPGGAKPYDIEVPEAAADTGLELAILAPDPSGNGVSLLTHPPAPPFTFDIRRGVIHDMVFQYLDEAGGPYPFLTDPEGVWTGRMDLKDRAGSVVVSYSSDLGAGADGTITFNNDGHVIAHLTSEFTATLPYQINYKGQRINNELLFADLEITDPADGEPQVDWVGTGVITQEVTAHA